MFTSKEIYKKTIFEIICWIVCCFTQYLQKIIDIKSCLIIVSVGILEAVLKPTKQYYTVKFIFQTFPEVGPAEPARSLVFIAYPSGSPR